MRKKSEQLAASNESDLFVRVVNILEQARGNVVRTVNSQMVTAYWLIGREIVEEPQTGNQTLKQPSVNVACLNTGEISTQCVENLESADSQGDKELATHCVANSSRSFHPSLGWTHYRILMRVKRPGTRDFYEAEAIEGRWSIRELERQINSLLLYERMLKSRDKAGIRRDTLADSAGRKKRLTPRTIIQLRRLPHAPPEVFNAPR